jgi:hypothetical protein
MLVLLAAIPVFAAPQKEIAAQTVDQQAPVMNNASIVQMVQAKISTDLIMLTIKQREPHFQVDAENIRLMNQLGVPDELIKAMAARQDGQPIPVIEKRNAQPAPMGVPIEQSVAMPVLPKQNEPPVQGLQTTVVMSEKPRVFLQSQSHGNTWNAFRDQSMEMSKDFEKACPDVRITLNQSAADYTVALNHIEVGLLVRDNQFQIADKNGDLLAKTKEGGSIARGVKKVCAQLLTDWATKKGTN